MGNFQVLLYYKFTPIEAPEALVQEQTKLCTGLGLRGRIYLAHEGINGTCSGPKTATEAYMAFMKQHPIFEGIEFKVDPVAEHTFYKLHVRVKNEIVNLSAGEVLEPWNESAPYIEPEEMRELLRNKPEDVYIFDARSKYEHEVGKFKGALTLDIDNFREIPDKLHQLDHLKDKTVITYCTGGIKCEKLTSLMKKRGFKKLYQLHGGIVRYSHVTGGENFEGQCYVFDNRVVVPVNQVNPVEIGKCKICGTQTHGMINCANAGCNDQILLCDNCKQTYQGCCSAECLASPIRRAWDGTGQYHRGINSKNYVNVSD